eukprot:GSChrysophyteH2.ASY1.ANO1.434.1 assembled CDS
MRHHMTNTTGEYTIVPYLVTNCFKTACQECEEQGSTAQNGCSFKWFGDDLVSSIHKGMLHTKPTRASGASMYMSTFYGVRKARGFSCQTRADVELAWELLKANGVEKMIFKPSFGQGGLGIRIIASASDIQEIPIEALILDFLGEKNSKGAEYGFNDDAELFIVEEYVQVDKTQPSPAVISLAKTYIGALDQMLKPDNPYIHSGNEYPTRLSGSLRDKCIENTARLRKAWGHLGVSTVQRQTGLRFMSYVRGHKGRVFICAPTRERERVYAMQELLLATFVKLTPKPKVSKNHRDRIRSATYPLPLPRAAMLM